METLEVLKAARAKLAQPGAWTREAFARDADGMPTSRWSDSAVCWCARGAVDSLTPEVVSDDVWRALSAQVPEILEYDLEDWHVVEIVNDTATRVETVLELFDAAIAKLEAAK